MDDKCKYSVEDGAFLVRLARKAVERYLKEGKVISPPEDTPRKLWEKSGVFVTIEKLIKVDDEEHRELRGCIGFPLPVKPLVEAVIEAAIAAAVEDPRFPPMAAEELDEVVFEVSILTPPKLIQVEKPTLLPKAIKVGRDGLIVEYGPFKGLLLPQVPLEYGWDEEMFLSQTCMKAGLPPDCWLFEGVKIYSFQAEVFSEEKPWGRVVRRALEEH